MPTSKPAAGATTGSQHSCCAPQRPGEAPPTDPGSPIEHLPPNTGLWPQMAVIPGGAFRMGSDSAASFHSDGEGPVRQVALDGYAIAIHTVTNMQYAAFVKESGYRTDAERFGWSYVFDDHIHPDDRHLVMPGSPPSTPWWRGVHGATWRAPRGPSSSVDEILAHPVVHVSHTDAVAYTTWSGTRLPSEAEWERAARGGLDQAAYPWGDELTPQGQHRANIWQGRFPFHNTVADGYEATAPAMSFQPNRLGLYNCAGNVWEWTADWFSPDWHQPSRPETRVNPTGPASGTGRVVKGGSFLCHASYCNRYRPGARTQNTPDTSLSHTGFRVAIDL